MITETKNEVGYAEALLEDDSIVANPDRSLKLKFITIPQFYHPYT